MDVEAIFHSPEARAIKDEIIAVGHKLWLRQYVDGNGGNITCRLGDQWVICTPTLMSKGDLTRDDLCMVDLDGNQVAGVQARSSELLLHLEIFKAVPEARAVVHCHPPHATAFSLAGVVPPTSMLAEHEVFVGPVAFVPYETPGTGEFARSVLPWVNDHNTILLANHGLVCWADSVTHAEWYTEVMDTTCRVLILASHLGTMPAQIPAEKIEGLLSLKQKLGMPDARFSERPEPRLDAPLPPLGIAAAATATGGTPPVPAGIDQEALVQAIVERVLAALKEDGR